MWLEIPRSPVWNVATAKPEHIWPGHTGACNGDGRVAFSPDGMLLAAGSVAGPVRLWNAATGERFAELNGHEENSCDVAFSPDGATLGSTGVDGTIRLWDVATRKAVAILRGHKARVNRIAYSLDGKLIASISEDSTVRLWDSRGHAPICTIPFGTKV